MNKCSDCKHRSLTTQWRYIKLFEWRCTAPKYTNNVGGRNNYLTCAYVRNHDGINHCYSFEEKQMFDMKKEKWFISTPDKATYEIVYKWLEDQGFHFGETPEFNYKGWENGIEEIGSWPFSYENVNGTRIGHVKSDSYHANLGHKEIKLSFLTTTVINKVEYPQIKSPTQIELESLQQKIAELTAQASKLEAVINQ